jgi:hypothetical protein
METKSTANILDEKVIDLMRKYDAGYDAGDWSRMDRMLDMTPKSTSYSISSAKLVKVGVIAASILLGSFLIYKVIDISTNRTSETTQPVSEPEKEVMPSAVTTPPPAPTATAITGKTDDSAQPTFSLPGPVNAPSATSTISTAPSAVEGKKTEINEEAKKENTAVKATTIESVQPKERQEETHPVIHKEETTRKEETKDIQSTTSPTEEKVAEQSKAKGTGKVGLSGLLKLNVDSIKKQKELIQKDTVK